MQEKTVIIATTLILIVSFLSYNPTVVGHYANQDVLEQPILTQRYDVTSDGVIDAEDVAAVKKALQGWESHYDQTDINLDGKTDQQDLDVLEEYLAR